MKAIILAAGQGTRLKKYTENLPKGMLNFMGQTVIERQLNLYRACGIQDVIIVRGFAADKINYSDVKYYNNEKYAETNMVESLMAAKVEFDDDIILSYSDILFDQTMLEQMITATGDFCVAVDDDWKEYWQARYGQVDFDTESLSIGENNNIVSLGLESPALETIDSRYIGLLKFSQRGLQVIQNILEQNYAEYENKPWQQSGKTIRKAYMTDLLNAMIEAGENVKAVRFNNGWVEFDTNEDYEKACEWVETGLIKKFLNI